jgi:hypothetical protein
MELTWTLRPLWNNDSSCLVIIKPPELSATVRTDAISFINRICIRRFVRSVQVKRAEGTKLQSAELFDQSAHPLDEFYMLYPGHLAPDVVQGDARNVFHDDVVGSN